MSPSEFIIILVLISAIFYWIDTIRTKEIACMHGKARCKDLGVTFLDETVEIKKVRLRRNTRGTIVFYREYRFEFSSDGVRRFDGSVVMLGKVLASLDMSAYPEQVTADLHTEINAESNVVDFKEVKAKSDKNNNFPTGFR